MSIALVHCLNQDLQETIYCIASSTIVISSCVKLYNAYTRLSISFSKSVVSASGLAIFTSRIWLTILMIPRLQVLIVSKRVVNSGNNKTQHTTDNTEYPEAQNPRHLRNQRPPRFKRFMPRPLSTKKHLLAKRHCVTIKNGESSFYVHRHNNFKKQMGELKWHNLKMGYRLQHGT